MANASELIARIVRGDGFIPEWWSYEPGADDRLLTPEELERLHYIPIHRVGERGLHTEQLRERARLHQAYGGFGHYLSMVLNKRAIPDGLARRYGAYIAFPDAVVLGPEGQHRVPVLRFDKFRWMPRFMSEVNLWQPGGYLVVGFDLVP